ncbi:rod shape-determining protein MreD [Aeribacillus composti]|uniref:rod shape-determining protein MreD n=1 Tax=Aeribacillus composti TaxID=1868734 RepID=UPI003D1B28BE
MRTFFLPVMVMFIFVLESIIVDLVPIPFLSDHQVAVPHLLLLMIVILAAYGPRKIAVIYGIVFGLLFDVVYTQVIGIYAFSFPTLAYLVMQALRVLNPNIFVLIFLTELSVALLEFFTYGIYLLIRMTAVPLQLFTIDRLLPTLALNFVLACVLIYPLKKFVLGLKIGEHND